MEQIEQRLQTVDPLTAVHCGQERANLAVELVAVAQSKRVDRQALEEGFVAVAADYSSRKGISYKAWREMGVPAAVLKRAGIRR